MCLFVWVCAERQRLGTMRTPCARPRWGRLLFELNSALTSCVSYNKFLPSPFRCFGVS